MSSDSIPIAAQARGVSKSYASGGETHNALCDVTVAFPVGEFTAIMGSSGSGKSTLMHILAGLDGPSSGVVWIGDVDITALGDDELTVLRRRCIGFVFQAFNLVPTLTVAGNILLPFALDGRKPSRGEKAWIQDLQDDLGLGDLLMRRPYELSGGQQQRVAIARALATRPALVFADEPTGNLDLQTSREVLTLLAEASRSYGQTIVMVTHDPAAASYADRTLILSKGQVAAEVGASTPEQIVGALLSLERIA